MDNLSSFSLTETALFSRKRQVWNPQNHHPSADSQKLSRLVIVRCITFDANPSTGRRFSISYCIQRVSMLESPGFFFVKRPGPGKSWKMGLVLESTGNFSKRSWKVLKFSRL